MPRRWKPTRPQLVRHWMRMVPNSSWKATWQKTCLVVGPSKVSHLSASPALKPHRPGIIRRNTKRFETFGPWPPTWTLPFSRQPELLLGPSSLQGFLGAALDILHRLFLAAERVHPSLRTRYRQCYE